MLGGRSFLRILAGLVDAHPLLRAVRESKEIVVDLRPELADPLNTLVNDLEGQLTLSEAMQNQPALFDPFLVNVVRAGEAGGALEIILERLGTWSGSPRPPNSRTPSGCSGSWSASACPS